MKQFNREKGGYGERLAAKHLRKLGFKILEKNFSTKFGEIDLICVDPSTSLPAQAGSGQTLHFVEVKLKVGEDYGTPEEMISRAKVRQVHRTAQLYLLKNKDVEKRYPSHQIDAVCIVVDKNKEVIRINHYESLEI